MKRKARNRRLVAGLLLTGILIVLALVLLEGLLTVIGPALALRVVKASLDPYEMVDPQNGNNWVLKPGYKITFSGLLEEKQKEGKTLAIGVINRLGQKYNLGPNDILFQVNEFGFKGPDASETKKPGTLRIMTIGDSTTFGDHYDFCSYPRTVERYLKQQGYQVEVLNAGVEGYSTQNVLYRLDYVMRFKPDIAIIFIGWNNLYADCPGASKLRILRASDYLYNTVFKREQVVKDGKLYFADHYWDSSAAEARRYGSRYQPSFLPQVRQLIDNISNNGVRPIIVTLPGLFSVDNPPSIEALQMGHLPSCTKNAYALAAMSRKYNDELRALATEKHIPLIDLEKWGQTTLVPPESWFFDSMHLWSEGQTTEGEYIAKELLSLGLIR